MATVDSLAIVRTLDDLRSTISAWKRQGFTVGFVPTMGALHAGHLALIEEARRQADRVVASIFVNPTQFAPHEDLAAYPRQEARDAEALAASGCDLLYAPDAADIYAADASTTITVHGPSEPLEGQFRPQMFGGVALVVAKLLNRVQSDVAVFGEKDWQQLIVVRRMVRDLDIPTRIVGVPTLRDEQGLALSSRNAYLSSDELHVARRLNVILADTATKAAAGRPLPVTEREAHAALLKAGFERVDYVAVRRADDLAAFKDGIVDGPARVLAAVWMGRARLIDNLPVPS